MLVRDEGDVGVSYQRCEGAQVRAQVFVGQRQASFAAEPLHLSVYCLHTAAVARPTIAAVEVERELRAKLKQ